MHRSIPADLEANTPAIGAIAGSFSIARAPTELSRLTPIASARHVRVDPAFEAPGLHPLPPQGAVHSLKVLGVAPGRKHPKPPQRALAGGHGLSLLVKPMKYGGRSRTWSQRLLINGKPVSIGLGPYPVVMLAEARNAALENRRALSMGHDSWRSIPTLAQSSERVLAVHSANWKDSGRTEKIWRAGMREYVMPQLGRKRVDRITTADVMSVLLPHWSSKRETMLRIKQRLSRIFRWSIA